MKESFDEKQMVKALKVLLQDDREYKKQLVSDLTEEEYQRFLKECPEFLEDE